MSAEEEQRLLEIMLLIGVFFLIPIAVAIIATIRHRRKYWDKENNKIKCGDCGNWEWTMYYSDKGIFRTWQCGECSMKSYRKEQEKNDEIRKAMNDEKRKS